MVPNDIRLSAWASHRAKRLAGLRCALHAISGETGAFAVKFRWVVIAACHRIAGFMIMGSSGPIATVSAHDHEALGAAER